MEHLAPAHAPKVHRPCTANIIFYGCIWCIVGAECTEGCTVQRAYAPVDYSILTKIDEDAKEKGISRAQWVSTAIGAYLQPGRGA